MIDPAESQHRARKVLELAFASAISSPPLPVERKPTLAVPPESTSTMPLPILTAPPPTTAPLTISTRLRGPLAISAPELLTAPLTIAVPPLAVSSIPPEAIELVTIALPPEE